MKRIITISREFGSGGRTIGKMLAERIGYTYFDKELIEKIMEKTGYDSKFIAENGEYAPGKHIFSYAFVGRTIEGRSVNDYLWDVQSEIIKESAQKENCVIVGRCADYILRDDPDAFHVFIHANPSLRAKRIVEVYGENDLKPEKRIRDKDRKRSTNYKYYTDRTWGMSQNYHLSLNSGEIGIERCVDIIEELIQK